MTKPKENPGKGGRPRTLQPVDKVCLRVGCGVTFHCTTWYDVKRREFCSRPCRSQHHAQHSDRTPRPCKNCGKVMHLAPYQLAREKSFCSRSCSNSYNNSGDKNPFWEGGNATFWKQKARERDGFTCQFPGCGVRHEGQGTHAHHKVPAGAGGEDVLENLVTMCSKHHREIEGLLLELLVQKHPVLVRKAVKQLYAELKADFA